MRALVIGGDGYIGRALCSRLLLEGSHAVIRTTRQASPPDTRLRQRESVIPFDLREPDISTNPMNPHVIYILAAITGIMRCEEDRDAWMINAEAPAIIAREALIQGAHVVFISSGTVERAQHTALARQKSYADAAVLAAGGCVVRPLPHVAPERLPEFTDLLMQVGERRTSGLMRWSTDPESWWKP